jgi:D-alanyl-D-alanine dipeptidase
VKIVPKHFIFTCFHVLCLCLFAFLIFSGCAGNTQPARETASQPLISTSPEPLSTLDAAPSVTEMPQELFPKEPEDTDFVLVLEYIPDLYVDLRYGTEENFTGKKIYDFTGAYLRYGTVKKLMTAQKAVEKSGYSLKLWDAFRPISAQFKLWEICPDPTYVSDPNIGYSSHSRGNTIDVTLVLADGSAVEMPSEFDDFSALADRDYRDVSEQAAKNAQFLENTMSEVGFVPYTGEWWHFSDEDVYDVALEFEPAN